MITTIYYYIAILFYLIVISIIDIKHKSIPAVFTTGAIFVLALLNIENILFGILAFIFAWFMIEADFFRGVADLKITTLLGLTIPSLIEFFALVLLILFFGFAYKITIRVIFKKKSSEEVAFVPVFLCVYIVLLLVNTL